MMSQYLCDVKKKYHLPSSVFVPKPKVTWSVWDMLLYCSTMAGQNVFGGANLAEQNLGGSGGETPETF